MWQSFTQNWVPKPMKVERKKLPPKTVEALLDAGEKIQAKFDADPQLRDLYYDGFNQLLDTIERNSEKVQNSA